MSFTNIDGSLEWYRFTEDGGYLSAKWINADMPYYFGANEYEMFDGIDYNIIPDLSDYLK